MPGRTQWFSGSLRWMAHWLAVTLSPWQQLFGAADTIQFLVLYLQIPENYLLRNTYSTMSASQVFCFVEDVVGCWNIDCTLWNLTIHSSIHLGMNKWTMFSLFAYPHESHIVMLLSWCHNHYNGTHRWQPQTTPPSPSHPTPKILNVRDVTYVNWLLYLIIVLSSR